MSKLDNKKFMVCCANGAGSSLMMKMTLQKVLTKLGVKPASLHPKCREPESFFQDILQTNKTKKGSCCEVNYFVVHFIDFLFCCRIEII